MNFLVKSLKLEQTLKILKLVTVSLLKRHSIFVMSVNTVNQKTIIYATIEKVLEHKLMAHLLIMSLHVKKVCIIFQTKYRISLQL
ncbi:hypothetical protein ACP61_28065 [Escherichia coli]|nr:hypothetical protein ACP61_28065 [Escherichia coli]